MTCLYRTRDGGCNHAVARASRVGLCNSCPFNNVPRRRERDHPTTKVNREIIEDYCTAYVAVHGIEPMIRRSGNWWHVQGHAAAFRIRDFGFWTRKLTVQAKDTP